MAKIKIFTEKSSHPIETEVSFEQAKALSKAYSRFCSSSRTDKSTCFAVGSTSSYGIGIDFARIIGLQIIG